VGPADLEGSTEGVTDGMHAAGSGNQAPVNGSQVLRTSDPGKDAHPINAANGASPVDCSTIML
jgi:hypothetical protein